MRKVLESIFGDLEKGVSWFNPPKNSFAKSLETKDELATYVQFRKDVQNTTRTDVKPWSFEDFNNSGYVRAKLTENKLCYVKDFKGIFDVFKSTEILFSFNK